MRAIIIVHDSRIVGESYREVLHRFDALAELTTPPTPHWWE
ncbi:hypothetical protein [Bradyrhizobium sp. 18]|nr:hypothetical protein [Bradyrhizobium sp. 18]